MGRVGLATVDRKLPHGAERVAADRSGCSETLHWRKMEEMEAIVVFNIFCAGAGVK